MKSPLRLTGIGLRAPHYKEVQEKRPAVAWLEVHTENHFAEGGKAIQVLEDLRRDYPISLHGVGLSLGSIDDLNWQHLNKLQNLIKTVNPCLISEHLSWSSIDGHYLHDLIPLPYTEEALLHVTERVKQVQEYLKKQILLENISAYVKYPHSTIAEHEFLTAVAEQSGCGILLDVNNVYVTSTNLGLNPYHFINGINPGMIQEIHLGGFTTQIINDKEVLIDSHNKLIVPAVWDLFRYTVEKIGRKPTMIEWDTDLPALDTLCLEAFRAEKILRETNVATQRTG